MKKLATLGVAAAVLVSLQIQPQQAEAKSLGAMIDSAINTLNGRNAYWDNLKRQYPYGFGYGNPYYGYTNPYYSNYPSYYQNYNYNRYYGVAPRTWRGWY